jgi:hypothetical protein
LEKSDVGVVNDRASCALSLKSESAKTGDAKATTSSVAAAIIRFIDMRLLIYWGYWGKIRNMRPLQSGVSPRY